MFRLFLMGLIILLSIGDVSAQLMPDPARASRIAEAKRAVSDYMKKDKYWSEPINWPRAEFDWEDLDGDGVEEAIVTPTSDWYCGHVACPNLIVKWSKGRPSVVDWFHDRILDYLPTRHNGWLDIRGYYADYHWDGAHYNEVCRPSGCLY